MASATVQEVDSGLYRISWLVEIKNSLEIKRLNFRLDRLPPSASYDVFTFCSSNNNPSRETLTSHVEKERSFEFRFRFWRVDSSARAKNVGAKSSNKEPANSHWHGRLSSLWTIVNGGERHDLRRFPGGSWNSEGFEVMDTRRSIGNDKPAWLVDVQLWMQFETSNRGERRALDQFGELFTNQLSCDVHFSFLGGEKIGAHALILAARSPVFDAMFHHDTKEAQTRSILIEDLHPDVFRLFLHYVYRGKSLEPLNEETVQPLYTAADKYGIDDLKEECVEWLLAHVRVDNAVSFLAWAHYHSIEQLKEASLEFIAQHGKEICPLPDWEELIKSFPDLSLIVTRRMVENMVLANQAGQLQ